MLAKTDPDASPSRGMTGFVVDGSSPGIHRGKKEVNMGQRCSDTRMISFENVVVGEENVVGKPGEGFKIAVGLAGGKRRGSQGLAPDSANTIADEGI